MRREGRRLDVAELDAIDGTPVLDIKPYMAEFGPRGDIRQPAWSRELMSEYWQPAVAPSGRLDEAVAAAWLAEVRRSPADSGTVELIVRRPSVDEREVVEVGELDLAVGLVGDNWKARGSRSTPDGAAEPEAQLNLMNSRCAELVAGGRERMALAGDLKGNLEGTSPKDLVDPDTWKGMFLIMNYSARATATDLKRKLLGDEEDGED